MRLAAAALAFGGALPLFAQEPPPGPPPLWSGKGELSFVSTSGNSDTQTLGAGVEVAYQPLPWSLGFKAAFIRNEADGEEKANSFAAALRGARAFSPRFEAFARVENAGGRPAPGELLRTAHRERARLALGEVALDALRALLERVVHAVITPARSSDAMRAGSRPRSVCRTSRVSSPTR